MFQRFGGPIAVVLELSVGPLVYALQKYDFFVLFPINPSMLAKYRQAFKPSGAKDDPTDAELAVDLVLRHRERFHPLKPQSIKMRTLLHLVEKRRRLVGDRLRFSNRLTSTLKQYYPQAAEWFVHKETFINRQVLLLAPGVVTVQLQPLGSDGLADTRAGRAGRKHAPNLCPVDRHPRAARQLGKALHPDGFDGLADVHVAVTTCPNRPASPTMIRTVILASLESGTP